MTTIDAGEPTDCFDVLFHTAESGIAWWVRHLDGRRQRLPVARWLGGEYATDDDRAADELLLRRCRGRTLDLACGPGRLVGELRRRGHSALGVDTSSAAVDLSRARGGKSIQVDIFGDVPHEGSWDTVLLVDGNVGIGGDPARVVERAGSLTCETGSVHIEVDPPGTGLVLECIRIEGALATGEWYDWARIDADTLTPLAKSAGLDLTGVSTIAGRHFAHFDKAAAQHDLTSW